MGRNEISNEKTHYIQVSTYTYNTHNTTFFQNSIEEWNKIPLCDYIIWLIESMPHLYAAVIITKSMVTK